MGFSDKFKNYLNMVAEGFSSRSGEKIADFMMDSGENIVDFKSTLKDLEKKSTTLNHVACDTETEVKNEELKGRKKRKREVSDWLDEEVKIQREVCALKNEVRKKGIITHFTCVDRAGKLKRRVEKHIEQRKSLGKLVLDDHERGYEKLLTRKMYGAAFGRNLTQIFDSLVLDNAQIIGIHGMPGSGKTALAMHLHNQILEMTQDRVYWVKVSENTSINQLQDEISHAIGITLSDENSMVRRATKLNLALKQRWGFVLILDNLREYMDLETIGYPLHEDGCRLIITTPSSTVCQRIECQRIFEVKVDEDEAWDMFKEAYGQEATFSPEEEEYVKSKVNEHCGFPQRIIELAKGMKGVEVQPGSDEWRRQWAEVEEGL